jgi:hypothetical protein
MDENMMLSCRQVAQFLSSDALDRATWATRVRVRLHLWMCRHCSQFAVQLRLLGSSARAAFKDERPETGTGTEKLEDRILRKLSQSK